MEAIEGFGGVVLGGGEVAGVQWGAAIDVEADAGDIGRRLA